MKAAVMNTQYFWQQGYEYDAISHIDGSEFCRDCCRNDR